METASPVEIMALWGVVGVAIIALLYSFFLSRRILKEERGSGKMVEVWQAIRGGANAYLRRQFKTIILLIAALAVVLYFTASLGGQNFSVSIGRAAAFLMGSLFSASVGYFGMNMAVQGSVRVAQASRKSFGKALKIAYRSGTVTGMLTDGLGLLGGTMIFLIYGKAAPEVLLGFGFGGTLIALFMRVGGGIYTKAADIGADLVGKVEKGIPEDDPRNAAVIADLVGDNVGDCAGMAADIFESYEVTIVSAMLLGLAITPFDIKWIIFPLIVRGIGAVSSIIGTYAVSFWQSKGDAFRAMDLSYDLSSAISVSSFFLVANFYVNDWRVFFATAAGILLAIAFNKYTNYFTNPYRKPVDGIAKSSKTGPATVVLGGIALGYESAVWATFLISITIVASVIFFSGAPAIFAIYGVSLAGIGMLSQTGNNIAMDTFGPISDNANGIGEMAGLEPESRKILADLDAAGNTTKSITKGIAIASAVIAAVSLFGSYVDTAGLATINIADPIVFVGLLIGGALPFLFSSLSINAVRRAASTIVEEVRKQFHIPGVMEGKVLPNYNEVVIMCTSAAQRELIGLALLAILSPLVVGFLLQEAALGAFLAGIIVAGQLLAVFMANAGGAWDNAKKKIEDGFYGGKGSEQHKAAVIGDTVGDALKDTAGPALNPMIKVINLISLLFVPMMIRFKSDVLLASIVSVVLIIVLALILVRSKKEAALDVSQADLSVHEHKQE